MPELLSQILGGCVPYYVTLAFGLGTILSITIVIQETRALFLAQSKLKRLDPNVPSVDDVP